MCTVTYLPSPSGFILTHNRDEAPSRAAAQIFREKNSAGDTLLFPRDPAAGGTWFAAAKSGKVACLLNGAFLKHRHEPPYRRSRGLLVLDFFDWESPEKFFAEYDLAGIEPFTFLFFSKNAAAEFRWDGQARHLQHLPLDQAQFWCSATLYPPEMQARRELVFQKWLAKKTAQPSPAQLWQLHQTGQVGDPENDFVMNRAGRVQTVSITQTVVSGGQAKLKFWNLLRGEIEQRKMALAAD